MLQLERAFSSALLNIQNVAESCICNTTTCVMDTLRLFISVLTIGVYLTIQVSLQVHAKVHFGSMNKCVDYAGDLIFKYPD